MGVEATKLYNDARQLLEQAVREKWLRARAVIGFWPAQSNGKDTVIVKGPDGDVHLEFLRQQVKKAADQPNISLSDFVAPAETGLADHLGAFVTTIEGIEPHLKRLDAAHDDYNKIMLQALATLAMRLCMELLRGVRKEFWGYDSQERLNNEQLIREEYLGIRLAPGYPACPDHTRKKTFALLDAHRNTGVVLTEFATERIRWLRRSAAGILRIRKEQYFGVGKIERDQVVDYAARKEMPVEEVERWLRPVLSTRQASAYFSLCIFADDGKGGAGKGSGARLPPQQSGPNGFQKTSRRMTISSRSRIQGGQRVWLFSGPYCKNEEIADTVEVSRILVSMFCPEAGVAEAPPRRA